MAAGEAIGARAGACGGKKSPCIVFAASCGGARQRASVADADAAHHRRRCRCCANELPHPPVVLTHPTTAAHRVLCHAGRCADRRAGALIGFGRRARHRQHPRDCRNYSQRAVISLDQAWSPWWCIVTMPYTGALVPASDQSRAIPPKARAAVDGPRPYLSRRRIPVAVFTARVNLPAANPEPIGQLIARAVRAASRSRIDLGLERLHRLLHRGSIIPIACCRR